ncbi:MAG: hypothetical protein IKC65_05210 [Lentisphaeria bacterium]|nr:hypothetical protein [Lentisphaeria bacterium]
MKKIILAGVFCAFLTALGAVEIAQRPGKATKDILIFPQIQQHYGTFQNFLHYWKDRPLFVDPSHRYEGNKFTYTTVPSVLKHIELARSYNVAGLTPLGGSPDQLLDLAAKHKIKNFMVMPGVYLPGIASNSANPAFIHKIIRKAASSPYAFRINGKVVINSYEAASAKRTPAHIKKFLDDARKEVGDVFLFVTDVKIPLSIFHSKYGTKPSQENIKTLMAELQKYLDATDGLYIGYCPRKNVYEEGKEYGFRFDEQYFAMLRPYLLELFARPQNKGKVLGIISTLGYVNHFTGMINAQEYGSETFRKTFEGALSLNPDFIIAFEWNEWNENTCFQPSVYKGAGYRRMIRYYQSLFDGKKLRPLPGDDQRIPNMLFSYRYALKYGDVMRFEMLNIPDGGNAGKSYKARIVLRDINGKVVHSLPETVISGREFKAVTQTLPSEKFAAYQLLVPELTVTEQNGKKSVYAGNLYIRFTPTENRIFQYVRVALREAADVKIKSFKVTPNADGSYRVRGEVSSSAPLASVELLDNRTEMRALGEDKPEFDQNRDVIIQMTTQAARPAYLFGNVWMENVSRCYARSAKQDGNNENFRFTINDRGIEYKNAGIGKGNRRVYFAIPRKEAAKAVLKGKIKGFEFAVPVADIMKYGSVARTFDKCIFFRFDRFEVQPDIPVRLGKKTVKFDVNVFSNNEYPVFHLRMIGEDGKLFRSAPIQMKKASGKLVDLPLWSETYSKIVKIKVNKDRIPDAVYRFDPRPGAMLLNSYSPRFHGEIGGGYRYYQPFCGTSNIPKNAKSGAAVWAKDEQGRPVLRFDGLFSNITFEPEVFPRGAFTFECEFKPAGKGDMALFRHSATHPGSIGVFVCKNKLFVNYMGPRLVFRSMKTNLPVLSNQWNSLKITSDINTLTITLNGKSCQFKKIGLAGLFRSSCFGGPVPGFGVPKGVGMFKGDLRKLRIYHNL